MGCQVLQGAAVEFRGHHEAVAEGDRRIGCAAAIVRRAVACGCGGIVQLGCEGLAIGAGDGHNLPAGAEGTWVGQIGVDGCALPQHPQQQGEQAGHRNPNRVVGRHVLSILNYQSYSLLLFR